MNVALSKELEEVAREQNFTAELRSISGGSVEDINCFVECLNSQLRSGKRLSGLYFEFIVNGGHVTVLFKAELRAIPEVQRISA